jgi:hypothetical protein
MANEMETALKSIAASLAQYVKDAAVMQVETLYVDLDEATAVNFDKARPAARTIIKLDGDSQTIVPARKNEAGVPTVDGDLFELHRQNVATAIEYRARVLEALLGALPGRSRG